MALTGSGSTIHLATTTSPSGDTDDGPEGGTEKRAQVNKGLQLEEEGISHNNHHNITIDKSIVDVSVITSDTKTQDHLKQVGGKFRFLCLYILNEIHINKIIFPFADVTIYLPIT